MSRRVALRVGPEHVGTRVVLRRRAPGGRYVDLLGELVSWGDGVARVRTRAGEASVPLDQVIAGKPVPPPPTRRGAPHLALGLEALEDVAADGWRPQETAWLGVPGRGWRLREASGFTGRANSALTTGDPGLALPAAVEAVERWYAERRLPPRFAVTWPLDTPLRGDRARDTQVDAELRARGYALDTPTLVMTAATREIVGAALGPSTRAGGVPLGAGLSMRLDDEPDQAWLDVYHYRGQPLPSVARAVLLSAPAQVFASVRDADGHAVAVGRGASSRGWTGITAMEVRDTHRRRGLAREVLAALAGWAVDRGDRAAYLQVAEANLAGRSLYGGLGFAAHHGYQYRQSPAA